MKYSEIKICALVAFVGLLSRVQGNPRQMRRMQNTIDHIFTEMGKFRRDISFVQSRIDEVEEMVLNVTLAVELSGNSKGSSDTGTSDFQELDHMEGGKDNKKEENNREYLDKIMLKMNMALKSLSVEKLHVKNTVKGLEKLVREGSVGDHINERLRKIEDKLDAKAIPVAEVIKGRVEDAKEIPASGDIKYSFSARLDKTRDILPNPKAKRLGHKMHTKRIQFADVIHNDGQVYNPVTGKFTCKKDGVYLFVFFVEGVFRRKYSINGQTSMVALSVDGKYQTLAASKAFNADGRNTGGNSVILNLVRGQQVWLETVASISQMITLREWVSTFSGTMLY